MKKMLNTVVVSNNEIARGVYDMWFEAPFIAQTAKAGQFMEMYVNDGAHILPRPISVCDVDKKAGLVRVVYQIVGKGTEYFSRLKANETLRVMGPIGNGFTIGPRKKQIVVGGGIGAPPLLYLCKQIKENDPSCELTVFLGFRSGSYLAADFEAAGAAVHLATDDGSIGFHGNVVSLMESAETEKTREAGSEGQIYACGPKIMLQSLEAFARRRDMSCQVSMEEKMACGVGACVGCVIKIKDEKEGWTYCKVCHDGPVFNALEVVWDE